MFAARVIGLKNLCVSAITASVLACFSQKGLSQTWKKTTAPTNLLWPSIACSYDGRRVAMAAAPEDGQTLVYVSTNSGSTWITNSPPHFQFFPRVTVSSDGTRMAEASWDSEFGISSNFGGEWKWGRFTTNPLALYGNIVSSADVTTLVSANGFVSTNSGASWINRNFYWGTLAISANGSKLFACDYTPSGSFPLDPTIYRDTGSIYVSSDLGLSWNKTSAPSLRWNSIACSADGTNLVAGADEGIFISLDTGNTWKKANATPTQLVTSSTNGVNMATATKNGIGLSSNAGETWAFYPAPDNKSNITAMASTADGALLYVAFDRGGIYTVQTESQAH